MPKSRGFLGLLGWIVVCFGAAQIGAIFRPGAWYEQLVKPSWNPPNSWFAPVWIALYAMMAVAAARVWRLKGFRGAGVALGLFLAQLALNALWSFLFFGLESPGWALVDIVLLWLAILATILEFRRHDRFAAGLLVPYLAWVSFATALNFAILRLNR